MLCLICYVVAILENLVGVLPSSFPRKYFRAASQSADCPKFLVMGSYSFDTVYTLGSSILTLGYKTKFYGTLPWLKWRHLFLTT